MTPASRRRAILIGSVLTLWVGAATWKSLGRPLLGPTLPAWLHLLSNSLPSLVGGLTVPLGFLAAHPDPSTRDVLKVCRWAIPLLVLAEVVELASTTSHFDWWDLAFSLVGVAVSGVITLRLLPGPDAAYGV